MIPLLWTYLSKSTCHSLNHQCWGTQRMKNRKSWFSCSPHISPRNRSDDQTEVEVRANRRFKVTVQINSKQPEPFYFWIFLLVLYIYSLFSLNFTNFDHFIFYLYQNAFDFSWDFFNPWFVLKCDFISISSYHCVNNSSSLQGSSLCFSHVQLPFSPKVSQRNQMLLHYNLNCHCLQMTWSYI